MLFGLSRVCFFLGFDSVNLLFSDTPVSGVCSENSGVMLPKSRAKCTRCDQITCNFFHSWVGLGPILPNRVFIVIQSPTIDLDQFV
jgi:hypothetical protein